MIDLAKMAEVFDNEVARIEEIYFMASVLGCGCELPEPLMELMEDFEAKDLQRIFGSSIQIPEDLFDGDEEIVREWFYDEGLFGFFVGISTPIMMPWKNKKGQWGGASFSWGDIQTGYFYGETFEDAIEKGFQWVKERREAERNFE